MSEILRLEHLEKSFGDHKVLRDINMTVNKGDVISVIGRPAPERARCSDA